MFMKRHLNRTFISKVCSLCYSKCLSSQSITKISQLTNRSIVQVSGRDSTKLLQGLITNDMNLLLTNEKLSMYSMMLNINGRIMYDLLLYKGNEENDYLIECDNSVDDSFIQLMKSYKLRSKVNFKKRPDLDIFCLFNHSSNVEEDACKLQLTSNCLQLTDYDRCFEDPRLPRCGIRVLSNSSESPLLRRLGLNSIETVKLGSYDQHRYGIGIPEGIQELSNGIPLEHNLAWLNGVSFTKGCYIGQELVARTHHVGVIRKRVMPLQFNSALVEGLEDMKITNEKGKGVGKVVGYYGNLGIGLMRLREVINTNTQLFVHVNGVDIGVTATQPDWWPPLSEK